ncbi:hypothetical protein [Nonlabens dokdonensis]|uniref:hypothetical protein n=1 Tax=Nonlabens dokdonensis TaxID=328515 RepID=UPI0026EC322C|nr:hypothetical protein [Nonlabens dokdonensis]
MKKFFKILGLGCLGIIVIFVIGGIVVGIFTSNIDSEKPSSSLEKEKSKKIDSVEIKRNLRIKDSLSDARIKRKEEALKILKSFKKKEDEFEGTAFYRDSRTPYYTNVNFIYPYIGQKGNSYWLRLRFQYASEDWLFIKNGILLIDGDKFTINGNWKRDNNSNIWEWLDTQVGTNERVMLDRIANSKVAKIRYEGTQYYKDRTITSKEKSIIRKTLEVYDSLKM